MVDFSSEKYIYHYQDQNSSNGHRHKVPTFSTSGPVELVRPLRFWLDQELFCDSWSKSYILRALSPTNNCRLRFFWNGRTILPPFRRCCALTVRSNLKGGGGGGGVDTLSTPILDHPSFSLGDITQFGYR